jgi:RES domain
MPIVQGLITPVPANRAYYRITSRTFLTGATIRHSKVVNGDGGALSRHGARYNYPNVRTVYLAEDPLTCFAEKLFYFHREVLEALNTTHITGTFPPFQQKFVLWEILFRKDIRDVFELSLANAAAMNIYPSMMLNPSQDYDHLKEGRAAVQGHGYLGLRAPSSRSRASGHMVVLFQDQSKNVQDIVPITVEFRLITASHPPAPFTNHAVELLDFTAGEVRIVLPPRPQVAHPILSAYKNWNRVEFNH